jgi:hypothetical protein
VRFHHFNLRNVSGRLSRLGSDAWREFFSVEQTVTVAMLKRIGTKE